LIFVAGAEGSGTTLLRRLLAAPECCASLGRDIAKMPDHPEARPLFSAFEAANEPLWDRALDLVAHERARQEWFRLAEAMAGSPAFADVTHFVMKRSFPFTGAPYRFCPDLWDLVDLPIDSRIVAIYRDPCAAVYSAFRRGFDTDLHRLAVRGANFLMVLASQLRAIEPARRLIISYTDLCRSPEAVFERLASFCGLPVAPILAAVQAEETHADADLRYRKELGAADAAWLEAYFDRRRRAQWDILEQAG
jgi:hypothetical protein